MAVPRGPEWWRTQFGIETYEEFRAAAAPILEDGLLPVYGPFAEVLVETSYNLPSSPGGVAVSAALYASGFDGESAQGANGVSGNVFDLLLPNIQIEGSAMPGLIIADCFQVNINMVSGGQPVTNVIGLRNAAGSAAGAAAAVLNKWTIGAACPLSQLSNVVAMLNVTATDISSANGDISVLPSALTGSGLFQLSTNAACALVKWNGGTRSRSSRGRLYFGPLKEGDINTDGRTLSGSFRTSLAANFETFRNGLAADGYDLVVLSRVQQVAYPVTSSAVESVIATQRRRIRG